MEDAAASLAWAKRVCAAHHVMKTVLSITHATATGDQTLHFGTPDTPEELRTMYQLRYQVYVAQKRYLPASYCPDGLEMDASDHANGCSYFIATCGTQLVGTVRLIHQRPLPIETHWRYEQPSDVRDLRPDETAEVSRLMVDHAGGGRIPPRLVPLGLIHCATRFNLARGIRVSYAIQQVRLVRHMEGWGLPVRRLEPACYTGGEDEPFKPYFTNAAEPVCPTYFRSAEVGRFFDQLLEQGRVFTPIIAAHYRYRPPTIQ